MPPGDRALPATNRSRRDDVGRRIDLRRSRASGAGSIRGAGALSRSGGGRHARLGGGGVCGDLAASSGIRLARHARVVSTSAGDARRRLRGLPPSPAFVAPGRSPRRRDDAMMIIVRARRPSRHALPACAPWRVVGTGHVGQLHCDVRTVRFVACTHEANRITAQRTVARAD